MLSATRHGTLLAVLGGAVLLVPTTLLLLRAPDHAVSPAGASSVQLVSAAPGDVLGRLPLGFEENRGQTDGRVDFLSRGPGYTLFLTPEAAVLVLDEAAETTGEIRAHALRLRLVGAGEAARAEGQDGLPGRVHVFQGDDPGRWRTGVPTYARVRYAGVYPGVDLVYYGRGRQLEYDFIVAPGTDPGVIRLAWDGADAVALSPSGDLLLQTPLGTLRQRAPVTYQEVDGARRPVASRYHLGDDGEVRFEVGPYDRTRPLVIDPTVVYATFLGGSEADAGISIAIDADRNVYVTGLTASPDFPTQNPFQGTLNGTRSDVFVTKINAAGTALVYSTYVGGGVGDIGHGIDVDDAGSAYVTGVTGGTLGGNDFPLVNPIQPTFGGTDDAIVFKLSPDGAQLLYSTYLGGPSTDIGTEIAVDRATGEAYAVGYGGEDFPTTPGAFDTTGPFIGGAPIAFKVDAAGSALAYSTFVGDFGTASDLALDADGHVYLTGETLGGFPITPGVFQPTCTGCNLNRTDAFVTKLNPTGTGLVFSSYLGGSVDEHGFGIALDAERNVYLTGQTESTSASTQPFPTTPGVFQPTGGINAYVTKVNPDATALVYSSYLGGGVSDEGRSIAVDALGRAHVTGSTRSSDFPRVNPTQPTHGGFIDAFVTVVNPDATALVFSTFLGGISRDEGRHIVVDDAGHAYVTGDTYAADFPTVNALDGTHGGSNDAFVAKYDVGLPAPAVTVTAAPVSPPVVIPPGGGGFQYRVTLTNTSGQSQTFQAWTAVTGPATREPVAGPRTVTLPPGATVTRTLTQQVPGNAPAGTYTYHVRLGGFPGSVVASDSFPFTKQGSAPRAASSPEADGWAASGWSVSGAERWGEAVAGASASLPEGFALSEAHPNPLTGTAHLGLEVDQAQHVRVEVFDALGRRVAVLLDREVEAGAHVLVLDAAGLTPGLYVVRAQGAAHGATRRVSVVR